MSRHAAYIDPYTVTLFVCCCFTPLTNAYRIQGTEDQYKPFVPYEKGFVGNVEEPSTEKRIYVNQGYASSVILGDSIGKNRLFSCPQMVGPFDDHKYYCRGKEYGYCDRRSGTCFCNDGYTGTSCEICAPSHFELGKLCYPKKLCPNGCSGAGECDYLTGYCECSPHREGEDCSKAKCSRYHEFCTHCDDYMCVECEEGFSVNTVAAWGSQCEPCYRFDPRCRNCNTNICSMCVDILLLSIHRSGRRPQDPPLPVDEMMRELSITVPFGSTQEDAFYDAEHYFLVDPALVPLNESAVECHQGLNSDDSISCVPYNLTSHIMCGNYGTITFDSPEYAVREDARYIRLTLQRTGGGVGEVSVSYSIYPISAGYEDVTSTAHYTANHTIVFRPGQIRASFLVTINDDRMMESNETFSVHLSNPIPVGSVKLGTQQRTIITIIDDDRHKTCSNQTSLGHSLKNLGQTEAGIPLQFMVFTKSCSGIPQSSGGDMIKVIAHKLAAENVPHGFVAQSHIGKVFDLGDGTHECKLNVTIAGKYELNIYHLIPGGLKASYYTDTFLSDQRLDNTRIDAAVNFSWGLGPVTTFGKDFVSVRWEGYVFSHFSETYTFWLDIDDHARFWMDGILLIDSWIFSPTSAMLRADHDLIADQTHEIVIEYRDIMGNATARLLWSSPSTPLTEIPPSSFLYKEPIKNSPFHFIVLPAGSDAMSSMAFGEGLYTGIAGKEHKFSIKAYDAFGNFRGWPVDTILHHNRHLDKFYASYELLDGNSVGYIPINIIYEEVTRTYRASYYPPSSGLHRVNVTLSPSENSPNYLGINHIFGSPFIVETQPGTTFAPQSIAFGGYGHCPPWILSPCSGLRYGMAGKKSTFILEAFDKHRNRRNKGGDDWSVSLSGPSDDYHLGVIEDHDNGTYVVSVMPITSGPNELSITLNGSPIRGSPFHMDVVHNQAIGTSSFILKNDNNKVLMSAMSDNILILQAVDEWGNDAVYSDNPPFDTTITVEGMHFDHGALTVSFIGGGKYQINVRPLKSGNNHLVITLNGLEIRGSPLNVTVSAGTFSGEFSTATGSGLQSAIAGLETMFTIQSKDEGENFKLSDEAAFEVYLIMIESQNIPIGLRDSDIEFYHSTTKKESTVNGTQQYIGDGKYLVRYTCDISGVYHLYVREGEGRTIVGSPFNVVVSSAEMSARNSIVSGNGIQDGVAGEPAILRIYARDRFGNFASNAVEVVEMTLSLQTNGQQYADLLSVPTDNIAKSLPKKQLARDNGSGVFILDYTTLLSGQYEVNLTTFSPGGIVGSYYSSHDFTPDHFLSTSLDEGIEKYWGFCDSCNDREINMSQAMVLGGAIWNGRISANHDEEYSIGVECSNGGLASMAIDGKYNPWRSCSPIMTIFVVMKAKRAVDFSLRYKSGDSDVSFVKVKWSSPSTGSMVKIPSSNFYHKLGVGNSTYYPVISPSHLYPPMSIAIGDSVTKAISGQEQNFVVQSRDRFGNVLQGHSHLNGAGALMVRGFHANEKLETFVVDNKNGTHTVTYIPNASGIYWLRVSIDESDIKGSPFLLNVVPGETDPAECKLLVNGDITGIVGRNLVILLQTFDKNRNKRSDEGDKIFAFLMSSSEKILYKEYQCQIESMNDGVYSISCPPVVEAGNYLLSVEILASSVTRLSINSSPFHVAIFSEEALPETTEVTSGGTPIAFESGKKSVFFTSTAGFFSSFIVTAKDKFENDVLVGGHHFVARVRGNFDALGKEKQVHVVDQGNGDYRFFYRVSHPSTYKIDVSMVTDSGLLGEYYVDSNAFKNGTPDFLAVDKQINFIKKTQNNEKYFFSNIRWTGYVSFPHTGDFQFEIAGVGGHCKIWIDDEVILDSDDDSIQGDFNAVDSLLYDVKVEFFSKIARLNLQLFWSSRHVRSQPVPENHLFNSIEPIRGSPFDLNVFPIATYAFEIMSSKKVKVKETSTENETDEQVNLQKKSLVELKEIVANLESVIDVSRKRRNFAQVEHSSLQSYHNITKEQIQELDLRIEKINHEIEKIEEDNAAELRVYQQKSNFMKYCHDNKLKECFIDNNSKINASIIDYEKRIMDIKSTKEKMSNMINDIVLQQAKEVQNKKEENKMELTKTKESLDAEISKFQEKCDKQYAELLTDLESRLSTELETNSSQNASHMNALFNSHENICTEMRTYYENIEREQLLEIEDLQEEIRKLKKAAIHHNASINMFEGKNNCCGEELKILSEQVENLKVKTKDKDKNSISLKNTIARLAATTKAVKEAQVRYLRLGEEYSKLEEESHAIIDVTSDANENDAKKNAMLHENLKIKEQTNSTIEHYLYHIIGSAGIDDETYSALLSSAHEILQKNRQVADTLSLAIAKAIKSYYTALKTCQGELTKMGVPNDEAGSIDVLLEKNTEE